MSTFKIKGLTYIIATSAILLLAGCLEKTESITSVDEVAALPDPQPPASAPPPAAPPPTDGSLQAVISATPTAGAAALTVDVSGVQSTSPGLITSYSWDFDDGTIIEGASTSHMYAQAGSYDVALTVRDDQGGADSTSTRISVFDANANILYVNNSGSPACSDSTSYQDNSASMPWCSLIRAVRGNSDGNRNSPGVPAEAAQAGDTVLVSAGTYDYDGPAYVSEMWVGVFYDPINSGRPEAWIEFRADGIVNLAGNRSGRAAMIGSNLAQYIKWTGFTLNQASSSYLNGIANATTDNVWFDGNTIIGEHTVFPDGMHDNHPGILVHGPRNNDCSGGISNITISNNSLIGWTGGSNTNDSAITLYCLGENILIENNDILDSHTGIYAKSNYIDNRNITIRKNRFANNTGDAITMQAFSDWYVYQNIMENNRTGFTFFPTEYFVGATKPHGIYVANNTMVGNTVGIFFRSLCRNMSDNYVVNNLIIGPTAIETHDTDCTTAENMGVDDVRFDWNFYDISGSFIEAVAANYDTWQRNYGQDTDSSIDRDPLFMDAASGDFRLQPTSSAQGAGQDMLDLDSDSDTTDPINAGAYVTGTEVIGVR